MKKRFLPLALSVIFLFCSPYWALSATSKTKIVTGFQCWFRQYSSGVGEVCVITKKGKECFDMIRDVKTINFNAKKSTDTGAEYKLTIKRVYNSYERKYGDYVTSIVFTGRVNKSTKDCDVSD